MKKLILVATVFLSVQARDYNHVQCANEAQEICKELTNKDDFMDCYYSSLKWCLADRDDQMNKSVPGCFQQCSLVADEAQRNLCYETCTER